MLSRLTRCLAVSPARHHSPAGVLRAAAGASAPAANSRQFPDEPRVGVGVVILRCTGGASSGELEVLLIRRAKEPSKGLWAFCGGSLELGESIVECAVRETLEETGLRLRQRPTSGPLFSADLSHPTAFAAADVINRHPDGRLAFHYAIVEVAAVPEDPWAAPAPGDDASEAAWFRVCALRGMPDLARRCDEIAEEAARRFQIPHSPPPEL